MVNVKAKKTKQTPRCRPSGGLSGHALNKPEGRASVHGEKTRLNSSRESRKSEAALMPKIAHNRANSREEGVVFAFVQNCHGKPLMPCQPAVARRLLKAGKAKVVSREPFVIKLLHGSSGYRQEVRLSVDSGSKVAGFAAIANGIVLYAAMVMLRQDIKGKMDQKRMYRRNRRSRKTRYRQSRFLNRGRQDLWLTPTMRSKVQAHLREIDFIKSIVPVGKVIIETASFDIHQIVNPEVASSGYQKGRQQGFANVKAYVLNRDEYTCQKCKAKNTELHAHHIVFRSSGGTDSPDNLVTLCKSCHGNLHASQNAATESLKLAKKVQKRTRHATQVSTIGAYLKRYIEFEEAFGYETKAKRQALRLPKDHWVDAVCIGLAEGEACPRMPKYIFKKRCVSQGDYQQTSGKRSEQKMPIGKLFGLRKFDLVSTSKGIGFVKGKRSSGHFAICDIDNKSVTDSVSVKKNAKRLSARKTVLTQKMESGFLLGLKTQVSAA